jgi:hypothetical protein
MKIGPTPFIFLVVFNLSLMIQDAPLAQHVNPGDGAKTHVNRHRTLPVQFGLSLGDLVRITQPIAVISEFPDGRKQLNLGTGFIVGSRYFTVHHNLTPISSSPSWKKITYLDGIPFTPSYVDIEQDVAIFDIPDDMCEKYCNEYLLNKVPTFEPGQKIIWLRKSNGDLALREGKILNYAYIGDVPGPLGSHEMENCDANLIVEVDTPFLQGSSGSPVLDAITGQIIGIIQGSLEGGGGRSGFFKPINCVTRLVQIGFN